MAVPPSPRKTPRCASRRPIEFAEAIPMQKTNFLANFLEFFQKCPNAINHIRTHPDASERIQTHPNRSEQVRASPKTSKNLRKPRKTCEKFAKILKKNSRSLVMKNLVVAMQKLVGNISTLLDLKITTEDEHKRNGNSK